jgi:glycosyltransferase involved in cell wall biosynthesis
MNASVIIPTHNRKELLSRVLRCYGMQKLEGERFELVVVDDGSDDDTRSLFDALKETESAGGTPSLERYEGRILEIRRGLLGPQGSLAPQGQLAPRTQTAPQGPLDTWTSGLSPRPLQATYVRIAKSGRSVARNIGIAVSSAPLIVFADDDIFVEPEFVKKHIAVHLFHKRCVVMGRVINTGSLEDPFSARWKLKDINTAFLATGNASVPKLALVEAGMFDEGYTVYGWEDFDLGIHLMEQGLVSLKRPISGYHYDPPTRGFDPARVYLKEKERGITAVYFFKSHPLPWVRRFTLVENRVLKALFALLGRNNWFLKKSRIRHFAGLLKLIVRYKGYFDGIAAGRKNP